jgi:hypothetical protein
MLWYVVVFSRLYALILVIYVKYFISLMVCHNFACSALRDGLRLSTPIPENMHSSLLISICRLDSIQGHS